LKPAELDFRTLLAHYDMALARDSGTQGTCICPFHEDHNPSLSLDFSRNLYYCFVCAAGGSIVNFVMGKENIDYTQAIDWLNSFFGSSLAAGTRPVFSKEQIEEVATEMFSWHLYHFICLAIAGSPLAMNFRPDKNACNREAEKYLHKHRMFELDRKKNLMKYIFKDLCEEIAYWSGVISDQWTAECMTNDYIKMLQICQEMPRPDLYFDYWNEDIDRLVIERDLLIEIKRLSARITGKADDALLEENKIRIDKVKYKLIDWLSSLKQISKSGIFKNYTLILEAGL
jgi:hypothetical protein